MTTTMKQRLARWMAAMGIAFALGTGMVLGGAGGTARAEEEDPTATPTPTSTSNGGQPGGQGGGL